MCIVMTVCDITSASAYIHNKHHLLLTSDWPQYEYCIGCACHNSLIIAIIIWLNGLLFPISLA